MPDSRATKPSLLLRIRDAADTSAWDEFTHLYGPIIRGYCLRRGLQEADAADICQEVLAQVAHVINTFDYEPSRGRFRDWLGTVTRNKISRFFQVNHRQARAVGGEDSLAALKANCEDHEWSAEFHARILEAALERIRGDFEASSWQVFEQVWGDDRAPLEVAREMRMTIDAVYAAKSRVLRRLREEVLNLADAI